MIDARAYDVDLVWDLKMGKSDVRAHGREPYHVDLISDVDLVWDVDLRMNDGRGSRNTIWGWAYDVDLVWHVDLRMSDGRGSRFQTWISLGLENFNDRRQDSDVDLVWDVDLFWDIKMEKSDACARARGP